MTISHIISASSVIVVTTSTIVVEILVSISHVSDFIRSMGKSAVSSIWTLTILSKELALYRFKVVAEVSAILLPCISVVLPLPSVPLVLTLFHIFFIVLSIFVSSIHSIFILHSLTENIVALRSLIWLVCRCSRNLLISDLVVLRRSSDIVFLCRVWLTLILINTLTRLTIVVCSHVHIHISVVVIRCAVVKISASAPRIASTASLVSLENHISHVILTAVKIVSVILILRFHIVSSSVAELIIALIPSSAEVVLVVSSEILTVSLPILAHLHWHRLNDH